jgi:hypothetical protein
MPLHFHFKEIIDARIVLQPASSQRRSGIPVRFSNPSACCSVPLRNASAERSLHRGPCLVLICTHQLVPPCSLLVVPSAI